MKDNMFTLIEDADSYDDYGSGCIDQHSFCEYEARVLAFGAIRRAVEIARQHDAVADAWHDSLPPDGVSTTLVDRAQVTRKRDNERNMADSCRHAIRAAIGSDKA